MNVKEEVLEFYSSEKIEEIVNVVAKASLKNYDDINKYVVESVGHCDFYEDELVYDTAYGAIVNKEASNEGFVAAMQFLAEYIGLPLFDIEVIDGQSILKANDKNYCPYLESLSIKNSHPDIYKKWMEKHNLI